MEKRAKFLFLLWALLTLVVIAFFFSFLNNQLDKKQNYVQIGSLQINVELADTQAKKEKGLSDRNSLCGQCGMLFVFDTPTIGQFYMRNMNFPLDIIWISDHRVVKIDANLPPAGNDPQILYGSGQPIDYVLEINSGKSEQYGINIGDKVVLGWK
jgi:hypothetical protein